MIEFKVDYYSFKCYINKSLHFEIRLENYDGMQSWQEGANNRKRYFIEVYKKKGEPMLLGYEKKENWIGVLKIIDENL